MHISTALMVNQAANFPTSFVVHDGHHHICWSFEHVSGFQIEFYWKVTWSQLGNLAPLCITVSSFAYRQSSFWVQNYVSSSLFGRNLLQLLQREGLQGLPEGASLTKSTFPSVFLLLIYLHHPLRRPLHHPHFRLWVGGGQEASLSHHHDNHDDHNNHIRLRLI